MRLIPDSYMATTAMYDLRDHHRIFAAGNDTERAVAYPASLDNEVEYLLEILFPNQGRATFGGHPVRLQQRCLYKG